MEYDIMRWVNLELTPKPFEEVSSRFIHLIISRIFLSFTDLHVGLLLSVLFWIIKFWQENFRATDWLRDTWLINIHKWPNCGKHSLVENHVYITCFRWRIIVDPIAGAADWFKTMCFRYS